MNLMDRLRAASFGGPLTRADRRLWRAARSLDDLCELTARWLEGRVDSQPAYYGTVDVDEDDAPGLTATLTGLNRAGYLTTGSQAGYDGPGYGGARCQQMATVEGFAAQDTTGWLRQAVDGTDYQVLEHDCKDHAWQRSEPGVNVTFLDGVPVTWFGTQASRAGIARDWYPGVHREALDQVAAARQVTIYDPVPGRNTLWTRLHEAADAHQPQPQPASAASVDHDDDTDGM
jgi:hypothetical protein